MSGPEKLDCNIILRPLIIIIIKIYCYGCYYHFVSFLPNEEKRERERERERERKMYTATTHNLQISRMKHARNITILSLVI